jgi:hypothetical protein
MGIFTATAGPSDDPDDAKKKKKQENSAAQNTWHKLKSAEDRNIAAGYPGEPKNPAQREACRLDLERYLRTYFPNAFKGPFCADHRKMIARIQEAETSGGLYARALFRGGGKTTIFARAMLHATMYGLRRFGVTIGATARDSARIMRQQKDELWSNELLLADFPEICYPFVCTQNDGRLARRQIWDGEPTSIIWSPDQVVFASIPPSTVGGTILVTRAITGAIKGLNHRTDDGTIIRPDFVLLDDVQTRKSAKSITATEDRVQTIDGDVLGLAGHETPITAVMAVTPIYDGDLACIYLSRDQKPEWRGETAPMVYRMPDSLDTFWERYRQVADDARKNDGDPEAATRLYAEHRAEADAGAIVAWPDGPTSGRLTALQYAMDLYFRSRQAFAAEYQCKPLATTVAPGLMLPADQIAKKTSGLAPGLVPPGAEYLTAFVDAGKSYLFYAVVAWRKDFTGSMIEYGAWPQQRRQYYSKADANPTIASYFAKERPGLAGANEATMLAAALDTFLPELVARTWTNADGDVFRVRRVLCDTGDLGEVVCGAIVRLRQPREKLPLVMPSFGVGIGATKKPMAHQAKKDGDIVGYHWRAPEPKDRNTLREVQIDTNAWKTFVHRQFFVDRLLPGSLTLYGDHRTDHSLMADHLTAELPKDNENKTDDRRVTEWKQIPNHENEGLDCLVGCAVGASMLGAELAGATEAPKRSGRKRRPIDELMREANQ